MVQTGKTTLSFSGKRLLLPSGAIDVCSDVCPCIKCAGTTPRTITATFSGINFCVGCTILELAGDPASWRWQTAPWIDPNDTYELAHTGCCLWQYREVFEEFNGQIKRWPQQSDCTGFQSETQNVTAFGIDVTAITNAWQVSAYYELVPANWMWSNAGVNIFWAVPTIIPMCGSVDYAANVLLCTDMYSRFQISAGFGGGVTLVLNP